MIRRKMCFIACLSAVLLVVFGMSTTAKTLFSEDFSKGADRWEPGVGDWSVEDEMYVQKDTSIFTTCFLKTEFWDYSWTEYTYEFKAMKIGGAEGFDPGFGIAEDMEVLTSKDDRGKATSNYYEWNLGGWGNTRSELRRRVNGGNSGLVGSDHVVELDKWHVIKIEVSPDGIACYMDGELGVEFAEGPENGRIGMMLFSTAAIIDDILVYDADGPSDEAVYPDQKLAACWGQIKAQK